MVVNNKSAANLQNNLAINDVGKFKNNFWQDSVLTFEFSLQVDAWKAKPLTVVLNCNNLEKRGLNL